MLSHPAWVCGLKLRSRSLAWIGTRSHPAWVCGLKQNTYNRQKPWRQSHPAWVCGLKLNGVLHTVKDIFGHTLRGCVD